VSDHTADFEESRHVPYATSSFLGARVLALAPHPDDESLACGGALALHRRGGDPVKVVVLTDGGGGAADAPGRNEYVQARAGECQEACRRLGVRDVEMWRLPDRGLPSSGEPVRRLRQLLDDYRPTLVYAPSPVEFHPDHRATNRLLWEALQGWPLEATILFWELNRPLPVNALLDVTKVVAAKRAACDAYESQTAQLPYTDCVLGLNRYRALTVAPACQYAEGYLRVEARSFAEIPPERALEHGWPASR
jgi:LmbE family N-acetylglucosaminyl deacetylase